jgi:hypothetical protein
MTTKAREALNDILSYEGDILSMAEGVSDYWDTIRTALELLDRVQRGEAYAYEERIPGMIKLTYIKPADGEYRMLFAAPAIAEGK